MKETNKIDDNSNIENLNKNTFNFFDKILFIFYYMTFYLYIQY